MCDASPYLGFHLCEIIGVFVWFGPWRQLFAKRRKLCMTTGCVCICCLLFVCFGDVKERVGVVVRVQHVRNTAGTKQLCTDTAQFRCVRRSMRRSGDGPVDVPYVWLQVNRGACPKTERQSRMSVTRQQQSTLGHRRPVHVGFPCSASRP